MIDVLIIGSGPAGLSAALYAKRGNLDVLVVEKEYLGTGQIAKSNRVDNYLGLVGQSGFEIGERFRQDAITLDLPFYDAEVIKIEKKSNGWLVKFDNEKEIEAKTIIYAAGAYHRKLNIPGEEKLLGSGVSFCALCDGAFFKNKSVAVIGGGDTAIDDAIYLSDISKQVYLIHRRDEFRATQKNVEKVRNIENIEIILNTNVVEICGDNLVEAIILDSGKKLDVEGVFVAIGMNPQTELLKDLVDMDASGYVIADETGKTKAKGLFVAGDVRTKKLRQLVTAVADGANAAVSAMEYLKSVGGDI